MIDEREPTSAEERRMLLEQEHDLDPILRRALDRVPDAWSVLGAQHALGSPETQRARLVTQNGFGTLHERRKAALAEAHLSYLRYQGFGFNFKAGTITVRTGKKGGPPHLLRSLIRAIFEEIPPEPGVKVGNRQEDRETIRDLLLPFFEEDTLDTRRRKLIFDEIKQVLDTKNR